MKKLTVIASLCVMAPLPLNAQTQSQTQAPPATSSRALSPNTNTTKPDAPFFVDTSYLNLTTVPATRDSKNPKYPAATELPDGQVPSKTATGNFIIGPTHNPAPETVEQPGVAKGVITTFTLTSAESQIYSPGIVRDEVAQNAMVYGAASAPGNSSNLLITSSHAGPWSRKINVYVPAQLARAKAAPFIVVGDAGARDATLFTVLDNLIAQKRIPPIIAITVGNGGSDAQGSERGREYDTVSGIYSDFVESEVLPRVQREAKITLTSDPDGRATMGYSSSAAAAFTMAWFHPERYHRVLGYSPTMVNQQWPHDPALPGGAWQYHSTWAGATPSSPPGLTAGTPLILNAPTKPIRYWFEVGDRDLFYTISALEDGMHDWTLANENMAKVLTAKGYQYQFTFAKNAGHVDAAALKQTLPQALEWLWADYPAKKR